jgi:hypothetical protein
MADLSSLILRFPHANGDHVFRVAKLRPDAIAALSDRLMQGTSWNETGAFGPPLSLAQAMDEADTRDFKVLDVSGDNVQRPPNGN